MYLYRTRMLQLYTHIVRAAASTLFLSFIPVYKKENRHNWKLEPVVVRVSGTDIWLIFSNGAYKEIRFDVRTMYLYYYDYKRREHVVEYTRKQFKSIDHYFDSLQPL